jgi:retinol dehydrogenase-13
MIRGTKLCKYFKEYRWSNIAAMIRNSKLDPRKCQADSRGRLVVITGATSGIGYATARMYASHGAELLCINRNAEKSRALCREIEAEFGVRCRDAIADMSRLADVHRVGNELAALDAPIDVLIHNAGLYVNRRQETVDGLEMVFVVDYLSSFALNYLLREKLRSQQKARILLVNSEGHRFAAWGLRLDDLNWERRRYSGLRSYGSAKTAQLLSMMVFDEYFAGSGVTINAMHPGAVKTEAGKDNGPIYQWFKTNILERNYRSPVISAEALYYLGTSDELDGVSGRFFNLTTEEEPAPPALDRETADRLWDISLDLANRYE